MPRTRSRRKLLALSLAAALLSGAGGALLGVCGPFTDVTDAQFCPFVLEIFTLGITTGTTPTTYDPASPVSRLQMAAFLSRTVDGVLTRGRRRAALGQFWTPLAGSATTTLGPPMSNGPFYAKADGTDVWVSSYDSGVVQRVRASDGRLLETWTGATSALRVLVAMGHVFIAGSTVPGQLYRIDPRQAAGAVTTVASNLGTQFTGQSSGLAFDGARIWSTNYATLSIVTPGPSLPWTVTTVSTGFSEPLGPVYDGTNVWITDWVLGALLKLDSNAAVLQTVTVGTGPNNSVFDGSAIWVPNYFSPSVSVVRASSGAVLATLTGNGLDHPYAAAFDGERILVTNYWGDSVSLWKAADLTPIGTFAAEAGSHPAGACSDGINFWIALSGTGKLARF